MRTLLPPIAALSMALAACGSKPAPTAPPEYDEAQVMSDAAEMLPPEPAPSPSE